MSKYSSSTTPLTARVIYLVAFLPAADQDGVGGFEWRVDDDAAVQFYTSLADDLRKLGDRSTIVLYEVELPTHVAAGGARAVTDWIETFDLDPDAPGDRESWMTESSRIELSKGEHMFTVTVRGCTADDAAVVMANRLGPNEDYGFDYTVDWTVQS